MAIWKAWKKHWASELDEQQYPGDARGKSTSTRKTRSGICPQPSFGHTSSTLNAARASAIRKTLSQDMDQDKANRSRKRSSEDFDIFRTDSRGSWGEFFANSGSDGASKTSGKDPIRDTNRVASLERPTHLIGPPRVPPFARPSELSEKQAQRKNRTSDSDNDELEWIKLGTREKAERETRRQRDAERWAAEAAKRRAAHAAAKRREKEEAERRRRSLELRKIRNRKKEKLSYTDHAADVDEHGTFSSQSQFNAERISDPAFPSLTPLKAVVRKKSTKKKSKRAARLAKRLFDDGDKVCLVDLRRNTEYNGRAGIVEKFVPADNLYVVKLGEGSTTDSIVVRPTNLCAFNDYVKKNDARRGLGADDADGDSKQRRNRRWRPDVGYNDELEWLRAMALVTKTLDSRVYGSAHFIL